MVSSLSRRGSRDWDLIDALCDGRLALGELYDHWRNDDLDTVRARLNDVDLAPYIDAWDEALAGRLKPRTVSRYRQCVRFLFPCDGNGVRLPALRSGVTKGWLKERLGQVPQGASNPSKYFAAWRSLFADLVEADVFERSPLDDLTVPALPQSTVPHIDTLDDTVRLVNAMPEGVHRAIAALREGAAMEYDAWSRLRRRDVVDPDHRIVWAHGQKNQFRDRQVEVDGWAWSIFWSYVQSGGFLPDALLFEGITYEAHRQEHAAACRALQEVGVSIPVGYTPHAARHTFAVRHIKEGREEWWVANNLGHGDTNMVRKVYGKFRPKATDLVRAQKRRVSEGG